VCVAVSSEGGKGAREGKLPGGPQNLQKSCQRGKMRRGTSFPFLCKQKKSPHARGIAKGGIRPKAAVKVRKVSGGGERVA